MKIYTKTGDRGDTGLIDGSRVQKDDPRVSAYGDIDELQATLGVIKSELPQGSALGALLIAVQKDLFSLSARLADPTDNVADRKKKVVTGDSRIEALESEIDQREADLPPLKAFILAGGGPTGAQLHLARTICRRAERTVVGLSRQVPIDPVIGMYLNRLSDLLFVMARHENHKAELPEDVW
ncbi:MAG: cob(I)yrinic acid a,c-diamide adenosyltransferase [Vicinamibacteria bacterium]|nr:cob(I)yrinic acid a,c-diamide adenosyltransferase [Vicinamibacteria bacterium]